MSSLCWHKVCLSCLIKKVPRPSTVCELWSISDKSFSFHRQLQRLSVLIVDLKLMNLVGSLPFCPTKILSGPNCLTSWAQPWWRRTWPQWWKYICLFASLYSNIKWLCQRVLTTAQDDDRNAFQFSACSSIKKINTRDSKLNKVALQYSGWQFSGDIVAPK